MSYHRISGLGIACLAAIASGAFLMSCASFEHAPHPYGYVAEPVRMVPPEFVPGPIVFNNLMFGNNQSTLNAESKLVLEDAAALLRAHPADSLVITGFASDLGSARYNMQLGLRRAQAAKAYLVTRGISPDRLEVQSAGEGEPAVPNASPALQALNRRVVLEYISGY
jgi:hypothetical protein